MKKVSLSNVSVDDQLAVDIRIKSSRPDVQHRLKIRRGTRLKPKHINRLKKEGVRSIFVIDPMTKDLVEQIRSEDLSESQREISDHLREAAHDLVEGEVYSLSADDLKNTILDLIDNLQDTEASVAYTTMKSHVDYLAIHGFDVCKLAINLCLRYRDKLYEMYKSEQQNQSIGQSKFPLLLGMGTLLQDIGNWEIPAEILLKSSSLSEVEWEAVERHPKIGHQILKKLNGLPKICQKPALEHHERYDGSGYPKGKIGKNIHFFSRIAAICDVYTALTSERPYRVELTPNRALEIMNSMQENNPAFDPDLMELFFEMMPPFPVGQEVVLSDGTRGVVSDLSDGFQYPKVRVLYDGNEKLEDYYEITANMNDNPVILN